MFVNYGISVPAQNDGEAFPPVKWSGGVMDMMFFLPEEAFVDVGVGGEETYKRE